jgi:predicted ATPase
MGKGRMAASEGDLPDPGSVGRCASPPPVWVGFWPAELTDLIGRSQESSRLRALLVREGVRLVTLTGPGGVGKTRLALDVASKPDLPFDVVGFVALAPVRERDLVMETIERSLGLEASDETSGMALRAFLRSRRTLLVLDNLEHLAGAALGLVDLLERARDLTILVTSRAVLRVSGEHVVTVPPLALPDPGSPVPPSRIADFAAVQLFVDRCMATRPGFAVDNRTAADVVEICRRLDGLPLAIELAAARSSILSPDELLARLKRRLPLLSDGPRDQPDRLRGLDASIAWSYDLLTPDEQRLFRYLAVFAGGFTLDAVESVSEPSAGAVGIVSGLVDKSLLQRLPPSVGGSRFTMLETIGEYAMGQLLANGELVDASRAHARYFVGLAREAEAYLRGPSQQQWRDTLEVELENLRAALTWSLSESDDWQDAETGIRLVGSLWFFWFQRGLTAEGRRWL